MDMNFDDSLRIKVELDEPELDKTKNYIMTNFLEPVKQALFLLL